MPINDLCKENVHATVKDLQRLHENEWITSGKYGSRDAVLIFKTNILNPKVRKSLSAKTSVQSLTETDADAKPAIDNSYLNNNKSSIPSASSKCNTTNAHNEFNTDDEIRHKKIYVSLRNSSTCYGIDKKSVHNSSSSDSSISNESNLLLGALKTNSKKTKRVTEIEADIIDDFGYESLHQDDYSNESSEDVEEVRYSEDNEYGLDMPARDLKITYKLMQTETKLLRKIFEVHGLSEVQGDSNFNILWTGVHVKLDILRNLAPYQRVNHFPRSYELTRKDRLYKNIERMQHLRGMKHFDIVPQSFILPLEYKDLVIAHNKHRGPWIVKPAASSRGRGIFIVNSPEQIPQEEQILVSKYIADPLCIDGHKCDLRVYVLVTSFDPLIIYMYEEGLVRLATVKYDRNSENLWNPCMHLCNYSINKYHSDYIRSSDAQDEDVGHKWTLSALLRHLKLQSCDTHALMLNIEDLIIKSILACAQTIISACRMFVPNGNNCFELYGFDILIDDSLKPWLLEVNLSPSMGVDSPLDTKVKACLVTDLLTCVGIPAYGPEMRAHYDSRWSRFRNLSCSRHAESFETVKTKVTLSKLKKNNKKNLKKLPQLTLEEQRIIRNARLQYSRRGGFVRIFPTDDSMQRYGSYLDSSTGIPLSTSNVQGQTFHSLVMQHNYNQMLHLNLYSKDLKYKSKDNCQTNRMNQYERALETESEIPFAKKQVVAKCEEDGIRLRKQILKLIGSGSELTQFQARQTFSLYLESILRRLTQEPKDTHEKIILKFLNKYGGANKPPLIFNNPQSIKMISKARSAMVAKLLGDFLELYKRDTEAYIDSFDHFGMIPRNVYKEFLSHAQESDLESVLTLHTNLTGVMSYLYNRCGLSVPPTPPIPSGLHGFLRALPSMVSSSGVSVRERELSKYDGYFKNCEKESFHQPH